MAIYYYLIIFQSSFEYRIKANAKINSYTDFDIISYNIFLSTIFNI
jgi:hypothetical protein